jgi:hypothetical protein
MAEPPPDVVDQLYSAPPDQFVALRDARAKELRKEDRAAADAVKRLRKPSVSAGAVNQLARRSADDVEALLAAGEALRQAQLGGGDREAVRAAARDERDAVERLVEEAGSGLSPAACEEVRETLHAAASDDEARELIRRGVLTEARQAVGFGGFGRAVAQPKRKGSGRDRGPSTEEKGSAAKANADAEEKRKADAEREAEADRKRAARERVKAARAALRDAEKAATAAGRDRDQAQRALEQAEREVERRREDLKAAEDA